MSNYHPYHGARPKGIAVTQQQERDGVNVVKFKTPSIQPDEVVFERSIGKGSFGEVFKGTCRGQPVAVKVLNRQNLPEKALREFEREVILISKYTHPNIVQFMGACFVPDRMMIVTEFIPHGDLEDLLNDPNVNISYPTRMRMAKGAALGMNWLHLSEHTFIHRDLKTKNLLVGENNIIKICDFGLSQVKASPDAIMKDPPNGAKGTPIWMAPEILMNQNFNEKVDVYSFGLILWCLLTRQEPYAEYEDIQTFRNDVCRKGVRPKIPNDCLPSLRSLIERCWARDPNSRPTFAQIINELDYIIIDYSIFDYVGRKIWAENFLARDKVPWEEFITAFQNEMEPSLLDDGGLTAEKIQNATVFQLEELRAKSSSKEIQDIVKNEYARRFPPSVPQNFLQTSQEKDQQFQDCLKSILATTKSLDGSVHEPMVSIEKFGEILNWFGPIMDPVARRPAVYENLLNTCKHDWFHGSINQEEAENKIRSSNKTGTFLVRFSSKPGFYTISQSTESGIEHRRISHAPGEPFFFGRNIQAPSLEGLIRSIADSLGLKHACPGSNFARFFNRSGDPNIGAYVTHGTEYMDY